MGKTTSILRNFIGLSSDFKSLVLRWIDGRPDREQSPYVDLTPVDTADDDRTYSNALKYAIENPRTLNIAISGPYGSGKSSIIRTFQRRFGNKFNFLNISLASFKEEGEGGVDAKLIERSILQQMLYGADANKLPQSRFKRIATPKHSVIKSSLLLLWFIALIYIADNKADIFSLAFFSSESIYLTFSKIAVVSFVFITSIAVIVNLYKASFGISLKKVSLKNAEIETGEIGQNSILNRHLDEIIYFFQRTNYDVVVIEDLDRFGDPEIFVKLREINKLINDNVQVSRKTKFLYAVKDDIFINNKNRAKFFDFIIPVIPIINNSNSLDKMQERVGQYDFAANIDGQFLREVSIYLDDLRLIHNTFNEFVIYYNRLKSDSLDPTKLLAMMVYKNMYPTDFEKLHLNQGAFHEVCSRKKRYIQTATQKLESDIGAWLEAIHLSEEERQESIDGLIREYIGELISHIPQASSVSGITVGNTPKSFDQLLDESVFETLMKENHIMFSGRVQNNYHYVRNDIKSGLSFHELEKAVSKGSTFQERKRRILDKEKSRRKEYDKKIHDAQREIARITQLPLKELIKQHSEELDHILDSEKISNPRLMLYLVRDGYIDENYHLYTSNFHEGRLTVKDRDFLMSIRGHTIPEPTTPIDTPKEICANLRPSDFRHQNVLNISLFDYFLSNPVDERNHLEAALGFISNNFSDSEQFILAYQIEGKKRKEFYWRLFNKWPAYINAAVGSKHHLSHLINLVKFVNTDALSDSIEAKALSDYLAKNTLAVFDNPSIFSERTDLLISLDVKIPDLKSYASNPDLLKFLTDNNLYELNDQNLVFLLSENSDDEDDSDSTNVAIYSSVLATENKTFIDYVDLNIVEFVDHHILANNANTEETETSIVALLANSDLATLTKEKLLASQDHVFDNLNSIPKELWHVALQSRRFKVSWNNLALCVVTSESDTGSDLTTLVNEILQDHDSNINLLGQKIDSDEIGKESTEALSRFIFNNDELDDKSYEALLPSIPYKYTSYPTEIDATRAETLLDHDVISLTKSTFEAFEDDANLTAKLIANNIDKYFSKKSEFEIDDADRAEILRTAISPENKVKILYDMDEQYIIGNNSVARSAASLTLSGEVDESRYSPETMLKFLELTPQINDKTELLLKTMPHLNKGQVLSSLAKFPYPYSNIATYGRSPKIGNSDLNKRLVVALKSKGVISSFKEKFSGIKINTFRKSF